MNQDMTFLVGVRRADAPGADPIDGRIHAAAQAEHGKRAPVPGAAVFAFSDAAAALRFAHAAVALDGAAVVARSDGDLTGDEADHANPDSRTSEAAFAAGLADRTASGCIVITCPMRAHLDDETAASLQELAPAVIDHGSADPIRMFRLMPRSAKDASETIRLGPFEIDTALFELRCDGERVPVEPRTFNLLALLARNAGRTVTKEEIFHEIWSDRIVSDAALSSQIKAARKALGDDGRTQRMIVTVHGRGFRLQAPAHTPPATSAAPGEAAQPGPSRRPTLVAMPFSNLGEDGRGAVIALGLTEDLINALTKTRWLRVITRNPAFALGLRGNDPGDIARTLEADYLLTGSLRHTGNRVRITAQATDVRSMRCLWSESFDREMRDIFDLQDDIATLVAARIANELGISEQRKAARAPRANLGAWELYQLGSVEFYRFTPESNRRCRELMRQAIRLDPGFGEPYGRLAYAIILEMIYFEGAVDPGRLDEALSLAEAGVARDDLDANALFALGRVRLARQEYDLAIDALEHAVTLNPCHALSWCGLGDSLAYDGRIDDALHSFDRAIALGPHDPFRWAYMSYRALAHLFAGQFDPATRWARRAVQVPNAHYWARANLLAALGHLGDGPQTRDTAARLMTERPGFCRRFAKERLFYVKNPNQKALFLDGLRMAGIP